MPVPGSPTSPGNPDTAGERGNADAAFVDKAAARASFAAARRARTADEVAAARAAIARHVLARSAAGRWRRVAAYEPLRGEPGSVELLDGLAAHGVEVLVPVTLADRDLDWRPAGSDPAEPTLGVGAIAGVDCVLAPALAVAADGTRLGRGGGSYDRALARVPASTIVAALLYDDELVDALPRDSWDIAVDAVVTPSGWQDLETGGRRPAGRNAGLRPPR